MSTQEISTPKGVMTRPLMAIAGIAVAAIVFVPSFYLVYFDGSITTDNDKWGAFGDYVGGTLNPILSFFALIALLYTIHIQSKELKLSRDELELTREELTKTADAAQKQSEHFEREERRSDIYRLIEKLANRINNNLDSVKLSGDVTLHRLIYQRFDIRIGGMTIDDGIEYLRNLYGADDKYTHHMIEWLESDLLRLKFYIMKYERISIKPINHGKPLEILNQIPYETPLPEFFINEFGYIVHMLFDMGIISFEVHDFYCSSCSPSRDKS